MEDNVDYKKLYFKLLKDHMEKQEQLQAMAEQMKQTHIDCEEIYMSQPEEE